MNNRDVEELYKWVPEGTPVFIDGPRVKINRVLRRYSSGPDVVTLHLRLVEVGYFYGRANGTFTKETEAAVRAFQRDHRLYETVVVEEKLLRQLGL
jgi:peptidoglycan hydrolase-like protein with peptidoglycan-binding domain